MAERDPGELAAPADAEQRRGFIAWLRRLLRRSNRKLRELDDQADVMRWELRPRSRDSRSNDHNRWS